MSGGKVILSNETESNDQWKYLFSHTFYLTMRAALKIGIIIPSAPLRYGNFWFRYFVSQERGWEGKVWCEWLQYLLTVTKSTFQTHERNVNY